MISDLVVSAVTDFLKSSGRSELSSVNFYERDFGGDLAYPACVISEDGMPEENSIIRGQWTVPVSVILRTIPEGDESSQLHRRMTQTITDLIGDDAAVIGFLSNFMQCNDCLGGQGTTEPSEGYRQTTFSVEIKAAEISDPAFPVQVGWDKYSVLFDGVDDYMDCGTGLGTALGDNYAGDLTVSMWFKANVTSGNDGLFYIGALSGSGEVEIHINSNILKYFLNGNAWYRTVSFTDVTNWNHLAVVYKSGSESDSKMYLNGVSTGATGGGFPSSTDMDFDGLKTIIGLFHNASYTFSGSIDEVGIFTSALSAGDITAIYNAGVPEPLAAYSPVGWWRMGDNNSGVGPTITDLGSGGNDGTLENDPVIQEDVPS